MLAGCSTSDPATPGPAPSEAVIRVTQEKDGDSFMASDGVEYRVGLINTPELSDCGGREAASRAYELLADGFVPQPYATDNYDRSVARITVETGDLGVILAEEGMANDRYLEQFRHEHPTYADELDLAFAAAREQAAGLWGSCWADDPRAGSSAVPVQPAVPPEPGDHTGRAGVWACHPAYQECLPVGPDLDCADVGHAVVLTGQDDPYRLDGNSTTRSDGTGCDSYDSWGPGATYPYYR